MKTIELITKVPVEINIPHTEWEGTGECLINECETLEVSCGATTCSECIYYKPNFLLFINDGVA